MSGFPPPEILFWIVEKNPMTVNKAAYSMFESFWKCVFTLGTWLLPHNGEITEGRPLWSARVCPKIRTWYLSIYRTPL
jgi:hypothetical protein